MAKTGKDYEILFLAPLDMEWLMVEIAGLQSVKELTKSLGLIIHLMVGIPLQLVFSVFTDDVLSLLEHAGLLEAKEA
jgi:hypothetical protein